jgi:hypothetical protein
MANVTLGPLPYKTPVTDDKGLITQPWSKWFLFLYERAGGVSAPSNDTIDFTSFAARLTALEALTTLQSGYITALQSDINDLKQRREL